MISIVLLWLLQVVAPPPGTAPPAPTSPAFPVQFGSRIIPEAVTVGQRFIVVLKVRAPAGAAIRFPAGVDSAIATSATAPLVIGAPVVDSVVDAASTTLTAAYRFTVWDVGPQPLGLANIAVTLNGRTQYVSLAGQDVFVRSVLPSDTTKWQPKQPRSAIVLPPFNWWPWIALLIAILLGLIAWWIWRAYRRWRDAPLPPFETAERAFKRIEEMHLVEGGEPERHVALMTDVLRAYLVARVEGVRQSHTTPELIAAAAPVRASAGGLPQILSRADLVKFARDRLSASDAQSLGAESRSIVRQVEDHFVELEKKESEKRAA